MKRPPLSPKAIVGKKVIEPPLRWEELEDGKEYAIVDTTDAGDWAIKFEKINKSNSYYMVLAKSARIFADSFEASEFINAIQSLGEENGKTTN
ncbi:Uncharacterised protein [Actinobacillus equuli]|nr:Uncharacterised protein [Actinobacillus equuli]